VKTVSDRRTAARKGWPGPLYLDPSALVKLYLPEAGSDELEAEVLGRSDLIVSDLAVTEITSAIARRRREGMLAAGSCARLLRQILADIEARIYTKTDLMPDTHREAERLLLAVDDIALRSADALHLAQVSLAGAAAIVTYDRKLREAALKIGLSAFPGF
jgi:predicted nucleic acid-binding protein